ncbi:MAG: RNA polymerase sigma24 factor [Pirellulaceae bacterium]|nr:MAG: RNA polymerase sigma24 factor [Pirellulaceae bacterium]
MQGESQAPGGKLSPERWVERYGDQLYRYAMLRLRNAVDAEEAVQQTFLAALQNRDQYSGAGSEGAWLLGILRRKVVDVARRRVREMPIEPEVPQWDPYFDSAGRWRVSWAATMQQPLEELERAEFWRIFRECLQGLPKRHATAFALRVLEDQPSPEVCEQMGISLSNLWVMLHRARLQLATCLQARGQTREL